MQDLERGAVTYAIRVTGPNEWQVVERSERVLARVAESWLADAVQDTLARRAEASGLTVTLDEDEPGPDDDDPPTAAAVRGIMAEPMLPGIQDGPDEEEPTPANLPAAPHQTPPGADDDRDGDTAKAGPGAVMLSRMAAEWSSEEIDELRFQAAQGDKPDWVEVSLHVSNVHNVLRTPRACQQRMQLLDSRARKKMAEGVRR